MWGLFAADVQGEYQSNKRVATVVSRLTVTRLVLSLFQLTRIFCLITNVYDSLGFRDSREGLQRELRRISSPQLKGLEQEQGPVWANNTNQGPKAES